MTIRNFVRGIAAVIAVVLIVVGAPLALTSFGRIDTLRVLTTPDAWLAGHDGTVVLGILTVIGWIAWVLATLSLATEALSAFTPGKKRLRIPGISIFAPASAVLIAAIASLVTFQTVASLPAAADEAPPTSEPARHTHTHEVDTVTDPTPTGITHIVEPGDNLWSLAEHYLGYGHMWRTIAEHNDTVLVGSIDLVPGMVLHIPADSSESGSVTVAPGDSLSSIAAENLGSADQWQAIYDHNQDVITTPEHIEVGWTLTLPSHHVETDDSDHAETAPDEPQAGETIRQQRRDESTAGEHNDTHPSSPSPQSTYDSSPDQQITPIDHRDSRDHDDPADVSFNVENSPYASIVIPLGASLAAGALAAFTLRRRRQASARPIGTRLPAMTPDTADIIPALAAINDQQSAEQTIDLHVQETELSRALSTGAPSIVNANPTGDRVAFPSIASAQRSDLILEVGTTNDQPLTWDFTDSVTSVSGDDAEPFISALALRCATGVDDIHVIVSGSEFEWLTSLDEPELLFFQSHAQALDYVRVQMIRRRSALPNGMTAHDLGRHEELGDAWRPIVWVTSHSELELDELRLDGLAMAIIHIGSASGFTTADGHMETPDGLTFSPHLVLPPARRALEEMYSTAASTDYPQAWWYSDTATSADVIPLPNTTNLNKATEIGDPMLTTHPMVTLMGATQLVGARGTPPSRAVKQCIEYCAWLLENPGATSVDMSEGLLVAEGTRRSNMSRLRQWLGSDDAGRPYLPDAYTGKIFLHPQVSSDFEQVQLLVAGGVSVASDQSLAMALGMVTGAPLADAAPGQWSWAEQLRQDIAALICDIGLEFARRALDLGDLEQARWAVEKAELSSEPNEHLAAAKIRIAHASGDYDQVTQLAMELTRFARRMETDLAPETVALLQHVLEGRTRARA